MWQATENRILDYIFEMRILKKVFLFIFLQTFFLGFLIFPTISRADREFKSIANVEYNVQENGNTYVYNHIKLENLTTELYATSYSLTLDHIKPENIQVTDNRGDLKTEISKDGSLTIISVFFSDAVVGKGKTREFTISFEDADIATKAGEVWEITIPKLAQDAAFSSYNLSFSVPVSFGLEAFMSPSPIKREVKDGRRIFNFSKSNLSQTGISAAFGEFQVFSFDLNYHLENPLTRTQNLDIAVPPDSSLQKVFYSYFNPEPDNIHIDPDGNWLAAYNLKSRERKDIQVKGFVQLFAFPTSFGNYSQPVLSDNLKSSLYWQTTAPEIIALASQHKTPEEIYDFVTSSLTYNTARAKPNAVRLGAIEALKNPEEAICMEFTDLFIAISRAAGIPAREVNGFAYAENPKIQPLSLVSDVLHAWPEYWDFDKKYWVPVDPTWGSTTGGIDFFSKLDLRHFAFVFHGRDPQEPYPPGSYKLGESSQKDVFVNFAQLPENRLPKAEISVSQEKFLPFKSQKVTVSVKNKGSAAFYGLETSIFYDGVLKSSHQIPVLPPYSSYRFEITIPFSFMGNAMPQRVTLTAADAQVYFTTAKKEVVIFSLILIFLLATVFILTVFFKIGKDKFVKITDYVKGKFERSA